MPFTCLNRLLRRYPWNLHHDKLYKNLLIEQLSNCTTWGRELRMRYYSSLLKGQIFHSYKKNWQSKHKTSTLMSDSCMMSIPKQQLLPYATLNCNRKCYMTNFSTQCIPKSPESSKFPVQEERLQKPIICLYGWLGCQPKYLAKFEEMYQKLGFETVSIIPSLTSTVFEYSTQKSVSKMLHKLQQVEQSKCQSNQQTKHSSIPFIVHCFSGNGIYTMGKVLIAEKEINQARNYIGFIFDSSPPKIDEERFCRGFIGGLKSLPLFSYLSKQNTLNNTMLDEYYYTHPIVTPIAKVFFRIFLKHFALYYESFKLQVLSHISSNIPSLFIYSENDIVVPPEDIEEFIELLRKNDTSNIDTLLFKNSGHIMHFKENPKEYEEKVFNFITKCEDNYNSTQN